MLYKWQAQLLNCFLILVELFDRLHSYFSLHFIELKDTSYMMTTLSTLVTRVKIYLIWCIVKSTWVYEYVFGYSNNNKSWTGFLDAIFVYHMIKLTIPDNDLGNKIDLKRIKIKNILLINKKIKVSFAFI